MPAKLTPQQLNDVVMLQTACLEMNPYMRKGQAFMIALGQEYNIIMDDVIISKKYDPYFDDTKLSDCKKFLLGEIE